MLVVEVSFEYGLVGVGEEDRYVCVSASCGTG